MKKLFNISVATIFLVAFCLNVSVSAIKGIGDSSLFGFTTEAKAVCEHHEFDWKDNGLCDFMGYHCWSYPDSYFVINNIKPDCFFLGQGDENWK